MAAANNLMTETVKKQLPALYAQDGKGDEAVVYLKIFSVLNGWRWYITEYDPQTNQAFGLVQGHEVEIGYVDLDEMQELNDNFRQHGFRIPPFERDLHFRPTKLGEVRKSLEIGCPA